MLQLNYMKLGRLKIFLLYLIAIFAILGTFLPFRVNAVSPSSILVNVSPENPSPGENVNITLNSYVSNLDSVLISWSVDGKILLSGVGKKTFSLTAPKAGAETNVLATISLPDGPLTTRIVIKPTEMVLLWQANDSYVPPFYKGKAMPTPDSKIKVVALPEIKSGSQMVSPNNMTYSWKQDYTNDQGASGYGKNSFVYTSDFLDSSNNVSVTADTVDQKYSSGGSLDIATYQPKIVFYKNDPTLGTIWEHALLDGHKILGDEIIEAAPYFISPQDIRIPILTFNWFINDEQIEVKGVNKNLFPVTVQYGISGTSRIKLTIENSYKFFANISKEINVEF